MSPETLSRQAIRLARRKSIKAGHPLTREEILRLQIQTVEPWKRIVIILIGIVFGFFALWSYQSDARIWVLILFGVCSLGIAICGAFGRKSYIDRELKKLADDGPTQVLDAIINGLV